MYTSVVVVVGDGHRSNLGLRDAVTICLIRAVVHPVIGLRRVNGCSDEFVHVVSHSAVALFFIRNGSRYVPKWDVQRLVVVTQLPFEATRREAGHSMLTANRKPQCARVVDGFGREAIACLRVYPAKVAEGALDTGGVGDNGQNANGEFGDSVPSGAYRQCVV